MKRKLTLLIGMLMSILVIGVGFAAWIIVTPASDSTANGSISVDTVDEKAWSITHKWVKSDTYTPVAEGEVDPNVLNSVSIIYGTPASMSTAGAWLINNTGSTMVESLTAYLYIKATGQVDYATTAYLTLDVVDDEDENFAKAVAAGYIVNPTLSQATMTKDELTSGKVITLTFNWGTNGNPYTYFNGKENNETYRDAAKAMLDAIAELSDVTFKVTISTTAPAVNRIN